MLTRYGTQIVVVWKPNYPSRALHLRYSSKILCNYFYDDQMMMDSLRLRTTCSAALVAWVLVLAMRQAEAQSSIFSSSSSVIRLRANRLRRPESCRENLPRKSEDLPQLVVVGRVREVYEAGTVAGGQQQQHQQNKALVSVGRVIKGNQQLSGSDIVVTGFNSSSARPCPNYVKVNDTWILLLQPEGNTDDKKYAIHNNNILSMNLDNLDRINALASDEPVKRRGSIEDILCEAHYCAYGRCVVLDEASAQVSCKCPESCSPLPQAPVCGSDNVTYTNECHLIKEGCRRQRPLFVTKEMSC